MQTDLLQMLDARHERRQPIQRHGASGSRSAQCRLCAHAGY
jgi:hypothetical protein